MKWTVTALGFVSVLYQVDAEIIIQVMHFLCFLSHIEKFVFENKWLFSNLRERHDFSKDFSILALSFQSD